MNKYKYLSVRKVLFTAFLAVLLSCALIGYSILGNKKSDALTGVPSTTTVKAIYDYNNFCYDENNMNDLATRVLNIVRPSTVQSATLDDLISYAKTTAGEQGVPIAGRTILTVSYGRYRFTTSKNSSYKPLTWLPVYISRSTSGDAILTLYLTATSSANGSTSQQEVGSFSHDATYSTNAENEMPSNSYGTSFMRAVSLGNNGTYADYGSKGNTSYSNNEYTAKVNETDCNKFNDFIKYYEKSNPNQGTAVDVYGEEYGLLYPDLATPQELKWQANESAVDYLAGTEYGEYCWPNEAYATPHAGEYYKGDAFNYQNIKNNYDVWKADKVWLPSLTEVGTGNIAVDEPDTTNGIWKLSNEKRSNTAGTKSWLRTANVSAKKTGDYSTYTMFGMDDKGGIISIDVDDTAGIRPAIHLNLSKIQTENQTTPPVNLPDVVYSTYAGVIQTMAVVPDEQKTWYSDSDMTVNFYFDEECRVETKPINAGTYYMMVQLRPGSNRYFRGTSARYKSAKFVIEKAPLYVKWTYEDEAALDSEPTKVEVEGEFYEWDINAKNVPKIGMRYSDVTGSGIQNSPTYPDIIGWYTAAAYIVDEAMHNYNYQLVGTKEKPLVSHQFEVLEKEIDLPHFVENGETTLTLSYKGKQYIQIANIVEKYISVEVTANPSEAMEKVQDLGVKNNVQTFVVESVAAYTFNISLKDKNNTKWADSGSDNTNKTLSLNITKAEITVSFNGLPSSWAAATEVAFSLDVIGVYNQEDVNNIEFNVSYWKGFNSTNVPFDESRQKYVIRANSLPMGDYYIYVVMAGSSSWSGNYIMNEEGVTQKFTVVQTVSNFNAGNVKWKYRLNGTDASESYNYDAHDTASKALELDYVEDGYYEFSLTLTELRLKDDFFVKPIYEGSKSVTDAGLHSLTVYIKPYDKNVVFEEQSYTIYFRIKESKFDISNVKWDYTEPFVYNGSEQRVKIDTDTLPAGLSVTYKTGGIAGNGMTNVGFYNTTVIFKVSDDYAKNYVAPDESDPSTFINNGGFSFVQQWEIKKLDMDVEWVTENATADLFFVPYVKEIDSLVNYAFERYENGAYVPCTSITSSGSAQKYRVTATLKTEPAKNYNLTGQTSCEFEVAANQYAVTVYVEINGVRSEDGAKFAYTGNPFVAEPKISNGSVGISSFMVDYYTSVNGTKGSKLTSAPEDAGTYVAVIKTNFTTGGNTFSNETEFNFEVEKADFDVSLLGWQYSKNGTTVTARFDSDQKKFIDDNGKEAVFAFEYDGTEHRIQLIGTDSLTGLTATVSGNTAINASAGEGETAYIRWEYDDKNYNEPDFPKTFRWSVTKARINFDAVKWGYIDADGVEHEFDKNGAQFLFTRDEEKKAVNVTVGLINLPSYVKDLFKYTTTSYTDNNFGTQSGNSFSAPGEYHTEVIVSGVYNDPTGNTQSFSASDFPLNISQSMDWEIRDRELSTPNDDGSWTVFDNKIHNLIELCGIPEEQLNYFNIEIVFVNNNNEIDNNYAGYNGVAYEAFDAGRYIIRFNKLDGAEGDKWFIWGQVELEVKKGELTVTWEKNGDIPVARVKGVYVSDRLETKYYIAFVTTDDEGKITSSVRGAEVDVTYIKSTDKANFEAQPAITAAYANNLSYIMGGEVEVYPFTYEKFEATSQSRILDKPVMALEKAEYTGADITFAIAGWSNLSNYLYILEGDEGLTKKDVGVYHVSVRFKSDADAYWAGSSMEEPDRSTHVLTFEITAPTKQPLAYPVFDKIRDDLNGSSVTFTITNWLVIQEYVEYEVYYKGEKIGDKNITLTFSNLGIYTVIFKIPENSIGCWKDDPDNPKKDYTVQLQITDPDGEDLIILNPVIKNNTQMFTGDELTFTIDNWDSVNLAVSDYPSGVTVDGNTVKATNIGSYTITVSIITDGVTFEDGSTSCKLTFTISSNLDIVAPLPKPVMEKASAAATGSEIEFRIDSWEKIYANYLEIILVTCDKGEFPVTVNGGVIKATAPGTYTVTIGFKAGANAEWIDTHDKEPVKLTFTITEGTGDAPTSVPAPSFEKNTFEFTGKDINFILKNWDTLSNYIDVVVTDEAGNNLGPNLSPKAVGKYTATFTLKDPTKMTWEDGTTATKTLSFEIKKATLTPVLDDEGNQIIENNRPVFVNGDGERVDVGDYFNPTYKDPVTGEEVPPDKLEPGKEYEVTFTVKEDKREELNNSVTNNETVIEKMSEKFVIHYEPEDPKGGLDLIWIIIIVAAVVLILLIIIIIIVVVKKRSAEYDDYDEGYDEYDDYDEEYDEYDDEYDDEDYDEYDDGYDDDDY